MDGPRNLAEETRKICGKIAENRMSKRRSRPTKAAPWFRLFAADFQRETADLKALEKGVYITLLVAMHERGEPIQEDHSRLAWTCGTTPASLKRALEILLERGLIYRWDVDFLWSDASQREAENQEKHSELQRKKSSLRWEKDQRNQSGDHPGGYRYSDSRDIDAQVLTEPERSLSSYDPPSTSRDEAARDGAAPPPYRDDDEITIDGVGVGWVVRSVSRRPHTLIAEYRLEHGSTVLFLMTQQPDRTFTRKSISRAQADQLPTLPGENDHDATA